MRKTWKYLWRNFDKRNYNSNYLSPNCSEEKKNCQYGNFFAHLEGKKLLKLSPEGGAFWKSVQCVVKWERCTGAQFEERWGSRWSVDLNVPQTSNHRVGGLSQGIANIQWGRLVLNLVYIVLGNELVDCCHPDTTGVNRQTVLFPTLGVQFVVYLYPFMKFAI